MNLRLLVIFLILWTGCSTEKSAEYWLQPENQNGTLVHFFATDEYCIEAIRTSEEFKQIELLTDSIRNLHVNSKVDSSLADQAYFGALKQIEEINREALYQVVEMKEDMIAACGGYCVPDSWDLTKDFPMFPVLPYRTIDTERYWSDLTNRNKLIAVLSRFDTRLDSVGQLYGYTENDAVLSNTNATHAQDDLDAVIDELLKNRHTLGAMNGINIILLATVEKRIRFTKAILSK